MARIFISYRRKDSDIWADRLGDVLRAEFPGRVFMDIREIGPGLPWRKVLDEALGDCAALLVVISPGWVDATDAKGNRRLEDARDTLRREVAEALRRGVRVFPLLVNGADMPSPEALPDDLQDLADLQGHDLTVKHWKGDVTKLVEALQEVPGLGGDAVEGIEQKPREKDGRLGDILKQKRAPGLTGSKARRKRFEATAGGIRVSAGEEFEVLTSGGWVRSNKATVELAPGRVFRDSPETPEMVVIPAGSFMMGSPETEEGRQENEGPVHLVQIDKPFALGRFPVTFDEWNASGGLYHLDWNSGGPRRPIINVSWEDAKAFIERLSQRTGQGYRLASEAEWEYAARAGTETRYPWGDEPGANRGNFKGSGSKWSGKGTAPVDTFSPNAFGLHDMIGNVWEWVEDCWNDSYAKGPAHGGAWLSGNCRFRVVRGGSWKHTLLVARSAFRFNMNADFRDDDLGFRVARTLP